MGTTVTRDHIKPILQNAVKTLRKFLPDLEVERTDQKTAQEHQINASGTVTHIGITGSITGSVEYEMVPATALKIASGMYQEKREELDEEAKAAIREVVNIATAQAVTDIKKASGSEDLDITPPSLFVGEHIQLSSNVSAPPVRIPLRTNYGDIMIDISLEEDNG